MVNICFFCDEKLKGKCTQISSGITPDSNVPYLEKICELLGEEFVIIVNSTDHMCVKCTSYLIRMDKLENEVQLIKNKILSQIQDKLGRTPPDQAVESDENAKMLNENLMADKQRNPSQLKLPSSLPQKKITIPFTQVKTSINILKMQTQQKLKQQEIQNQLQVQKQQHDSVYRMKKKECRTQVKLQKPTHLNQKELEIPVVTQTAAAKILIPVPQKKNIKYRCLVCSSSYDSRLLYHKHVSEKHMKKLTTLISSRERAKKYSCPETADIRKLWSQFVGFPIHIDDNQQDTKKGTVDAVMMLNYNGPVQKSADTEQLEETNNSSEYCSC